MEPLREVVRTDESTAYLDNGDRITLPPDIADNVIDEECYAMEWSANNIWPVLYYFPVNGRASVTYNGNSHWFDARDDGIVYEYDGIVWSIPYAFIAVYGLPEYDDGMDLIVRFEDAELPFEQTLLNWTRDHEEE